MNKIYEVTVSTNGLIGIIRKFESEEKAFKVANEYLGVDVYEDDITFEIIENLNINEDSWYHVSVAECVFSDDEYAYVKRASYNAFIAVEDGGWCGKLYLNDQKRESLRLIANENGQILDSSYYENFFTE